MENPFQGFQENRAGKSPCNGINYYNFRVGNGQRDFSVHTANESNSATQRAGEIKVIILLCSNVNNLQHRNHGAGRKVTQKTLEYVIHSLFFRKLLFLLCQNRSLSKVLKCPAADCEKSWSSSQAKEIRLWET